MFYVTNCHLEDTSWKVRIQRGAWEQPYEKRASWTIHATSFQVCDTSESSALGHRKQATGCRGLKESEVKDGFQETQTSGLPSL